MVEGLDQVFKNLDSFEAKVKAKQKIALGLTANRYMNDVKRITPISTYIPKINPQPGSLRRSIHLEWLGDDSVLVGTNLPYARRIEYGFVGKDKLGRYYNQAAQPYFRPPLETNKKKYVNTFVEIIK